MTDQGNPKREKLLKEFEDLENRSREYYDRWRNSFSNERSADNNRPPRFGSEKQEENEG